MKSTPFNETYLYCKKHHARAYFKHDTQVFCFTHFAGPGKAPLRFLYLAMYKLPLVYLPGLTVNDNLPINQCFRGVKALMQDVMAPFAQVLKSEYSLSYISVDDELDPTEIQLTSKILRKAFYQSAYYWNFDFRIGGNGLVGLKGYYNNREIELQWK